MAQTMTGEMTTDLSMQILRVGLVGIAFSIASSLFAVLTLTLKLWGLVSWWGWLDFLLLLPVPSILVSVSLIALAMLCCLLEKPTVT